MEAPKILPDGNVVAKSDSPGGYLMLLATAARELGLEVADLLDWAEEANCVVEGAAINRGAPLRVCVLVRAEGGVDYVHRYPPDIREKFGLAELPGMAPVDHRYAFITATNTPGFFHKLADGAAKLGEGDMLTMVDGSGMVWAAGMRVRLAGLRVPREDFEALRTNKARAEDLSEKRAATLLKIIGAMAKLLAKTAFEFGQEDNPNARQIAEDLAALVPDGSPSASTIANKLAEGLAALSACNAIGAANPRKRGRKASERA